MVWLRWDLQLPKTSRCLDNDWQLPLADWDSGSIHPGVCNKSRNGDGIKLVVVFGITPHFRYAKISLLVPPTLSGLRRAGRGGLLRFLA
jgi:hypothetical protein